MSDFSKAQAPQRYLRIPVRRLLVRPGAHAIQNHRDPCHFAVYKHLLLGLEPSTLPEHMDNAIRTTNAALWCQLVKINAVDQHQALWRSHRDRDNLSISNRSPK